MIWGQTCHLLALRQAARQVAQLGKAGRQPILDFALRASALPQRTLLSDLKLQHLLGRTFQLQSGHRALKQWASGQLLFSQANNGAKCASRWKWFYTKLNFSVYLFSSTVFIYLSVIYLLFIIIPIIYLLLLYFLVVRELT